MVGILEELRERPLAAVIDTYAADQPKALLQYIDFLQDYPNAIFLAEAEASLYLQATTTVVWAPVGETPTVPISTQREKVSFYGSLNLVSGQETVNRVETMNSEATARHLQQIADVYPNKPILLFWDRATWHGGEAVKTFLAQTPRLQVIRFPPGSPDLNPQEYIWKAARQHISHNHGQTALSLLADRFEDFLQSRTFNYSFLEKFNTKILGTIFAHFDAHSATSI